MCAALAVTQGPVHRGATRPFGPLNFHAERWTIVPRASVPTGLGETNPTAAKRFGVAGARLTPAVGAVVVDVDA
jgi:hypothetical protein